MTGLAAARSFLEAITGFTDEPSEGYTPSQDRPARIATVDPAYSGTGAARVTFDGESVLSAKPYALAVPVRPSDRVCMLPVGRGYLVISVIGLAVANPLTAARNRNKLDNGSFRVNQRAVATAVVLLPGQYGFDRWKASGHENLVTNPSAEVNTTGWAATSCTLTRVNTWAESGTWSFQLSAPAAADSFAQLSIPTIIGRTYTVSGTARLTGALTGSEVGAGQARTISARSGAGNLLAASPQLPNVAGQARLSVSFVAIETTTPIRIYHGHTVGTIWWDAIMFTEGNILLPYMDGSTGSPAIWQGTAHASISQSQASTTLTFTSAPQGQLVTISDGGGLVQVIERADVQAEASVFSWAGAATGRTFTHDTAGYSAPPALAASPITVTPGGLTDRVVEVRAVGGARTFGLAQFELGSVPTPFERISLADDLMACQRFYFRRQGSYGTNLAFGFQNSTTGAFAFLTLPVPMRAIPDVLWNDVVWSDNTVFEGLVSRIVIESTFAFDTSYGILTITFAANGVARQPGSLYVRNFGGTGRLELSADF